MLIDHDESTFDCNVQYLQKMLRKSAGCRKPTSSTEDVVSIVIGQCAPTRFLVIAIELRIEVNKK